MNKEFITLKNIQTSLNLGRSTILRFLKPKREEYIKKGFIVQSKGNKKTLYKIDLIEIIKNNFNENKNNKMVINKDILDRETETRQWRDNKETVLDQSRDSGETVEDFSKKNSSFKILSLEKDLEHLETRLKEKNLYINEMKKTNENKEEKISELTNLVSDLTSRHDTIILTMSKQLESLNSKLVLLEDKTEPEKEILNIPKTDYSLLITRAVIFSILIIIYVKVLYI